MQITLKEARLFLLAKQGLINEHKYSSKTGVLDFLAQAGCIQFDPIDICGKNPDLVLFSRVQNYDKSMLEELLYNERMLIDGWDKMMSIYLMSDFSKMSYIRKMHAKRYENKLLGLEAEIEIVKNMLKTNEFIEGKDLAIKKESHFDLWRHKNLGKAILEYLFFKGEAIVHHRKGSKRFFSDMDKYNNLDNGNHYFETEEAFHKFQIKRRISAVGMLSEKTSDAYLGLYFKTELRKKYIAELLEAQELVLIKINELEEPYYILAEDIKYLTITLKEPRVEFIAPLDNFIWDRKLIKKVFDFEYKWEIYHTKEKRKFAPYVMPILYGTQFIGQIEMVVDRKNKQLNVKNIWYKDDKPEKSVITKIENRIKDFAKFNNCDKTNFKDLLIHVYNE
ncbi:conserved hypothetical protein (DUF1006) [Alteracholeplasma palmae J233]|uniref:Cytoplasmic protein n=1 Tax=Alteracholeplasma palmae (strain ATCC 49389 / J233) TaxID=1318466 RepID=U4KR33_ALTPJ|nr:crosslink repair DNA glycosylase YcaQ family protein [Alteracholeplasma palmae]CCV63826.1 conserved hypothetical protein (DUF1006) [Alteracholeplasma palmae J233]